MNNRFEKEMKVNFQFNYPNSLEFDYSTTIETIDLDVERKNDIESGNGFIISSPKATIKKDIKNPDGIYSSKFGQKLGDLNPFADRYSCECGNLTSRINHGMECEVCHTVCKYIDDDFKKFGWIVLNDEYHILNPKFFDTLNAFFGTSKYTTDRKMANTLPKAKRDRCTILINMLNFSPEVDKHGFYSPCQFKPDNEPFFGIGMIEFYNRFDEIIDYYIKKKPKKINYYDELIDYRYACDCRHTIGKDNLGCKCKICGTDVKYIDKDFIFTHSIPVYTTHLRPIDIMDKSMYYESSNGIYNMINKHVHAINKNKRKIDNNFVIKNTELFKVQMKYLDLSEEIIKIFSGKKGELRKLVGGRYNFSARCVIRQDSSLRIDQVKLPYEVLVICLEQRIINILVRSYNISPSEAHSIVEKAKATRNPRIAEIIDNMIASEPEGIAILINRNPTINYGSILQVFVVEQTQSYTLSLSLEVLKLLGADFDGDQMNLLFIINKIFFERANIVFNPRKAMQISRIDGKLNKDIIPQRDTIINTNTLIYLGRHVYSKEDMKLIEQIKEKQKQYFQI